MNDKVGGGGKGAVYVLHNFNVLLQIAALEVKAKLVVGEGAGLVDKCVVYV